MTRETVEDRVAETIAPEAYESTTWDRGQQYEAIQKAQEIVDIVAIEYNQYLDFIEKADRKLRSSELLEHLTGSDHEAIEGILVDVAESIIEDLERKL